MIVQKDSEFETFYELASELQGYAIEVRYPNKAVFLTKEKVEEAIMIAKKIRKFVTTKMNLTIEYPDIIDQ